MSKTPDEISAQIRATLATTIPGLSCEIGTPERKIIDACSEAVSEGYIDQYLLGSLMDIDTKGGLELEQFVGIFGFGRLQGVSATGIVRISVNTPNSADSTFQLGTQFYTTPGLAGAVITLYYSSTQAVVLVAGDTSCDIPLQCTVVGTQGNVPPGSITYQGNVIGGSTCTNLTAFTGGVDAETDSELRQRFKDTLLRNIAGTSDWYEALCQQNNNVSRVVVFGPLSLYKTQIAVPPTSLTLAVNQDVKYAWPAMETVFTDIGTEEETFYSSINDYTFVGGAAPQFITNGAGSLTTGDIVDVEFQYTTRASRNDPLSGVTDKVDVFVDGTDPVSVSESTVVSGDHLAVSGADPLSIDNFRRVGTSGTPSTSSRFTRLGSVPVVSFPSSITIAGITYTQGTHYHLLAPNTANANQVTLLAGTQLETAGIEWVGANPTTGAEIPGLTYVYNRTPELLNAVIAGAKQVTTDVLVHQATQAYIQPCYDIEYSRAFSVATVNSTIVNRLQQYFAALPFGSPIKLSNLQMVVQQSLGVVDCKILTTDPGSGIYGVQIYANSADPSPDTIETADFKLDDNQVAVYQGVLLHRVATP